MSNVPSYTNPTNLSSEIRSIDGQCFVGTFTHPNPAGIHDLRNFDKDQLGVRY